MGITIILAAMQLGVSRLGWIHMQCAQDVEADADWLVDHLIP